MHKEYIPPVYNAGTVLVIKEAGNPRDFLVDILAEKNFEVLIADKPSLFFKIWGESNQKLSLIFLDPKMNCWDTVLACIKREKPDISVIAHFGKKPKKEILDQFQTAICQQDYVGAITDVIQNHHKSANLKTA